MTDKRMTDERLAQLWLLMENTSWREVNALPAELLQALNAERKLALEATACRFAAASGSRLPIAKNRCDVRIEEQEKRISELEKMLIDAGHCPKCNELWVARHNVGKRMVARCPDCGWSE